MDSVTPRAIIWDTAITTVLANGRVTFSEIEEVVTRETDINVTSEEIRDMIDGIVDFGWLEPVGDNTWISGPKCDKLGGNGPASPPSP